MIGFTLLWAKMLDSSIWVKESKETRLLWVTMMMMRDFKGQIYSSVVGLANRARISDEECEKSLKILLSPDKNDTSGVEEGRRLREIPGGWEIVNHDFYRFTTEEKREFWKQQKAEQRARAAAKESMKKLPKAQEERNKKRRATLADKAIKANFIAEDSKGPVNSPLANPDQSIQG